MKKICERCGNKIKPPNFIVNSGTNLEEFFECAECELIYSIDQTRDAFEDIPIKESLPFILNQLDKIRELERKLMKPLSTINSLLVDKFELDFVLSIIIESLDNQDQLKRFFDLIVFNKITKSWYNFKRK